MASGIPGVLRCCRAEDGFTVAMVSVKEELTIDELSALKARVVGQEQHILRKGDCECKLADAETNEIQISVRFPSGLSNEAQLFVLNELINRLSPLIRVESIDVSELSKSAIH